MSRLPRWFVQHIPWLVAGLILVALASKEPAFQRPSYWLAMSYQYFAPAVLALALTPIILSGGIDLSVGSVAVFVSVVIGALWRDLGWPVELAIAAGVVAGLLAGLGNALLVTAGVMPLVATLATRELFRGLAWTLSGDTPVDRFPTSLQDIWRKSLLGTPLPLLVIALILIFTYVLVHHTWLGRAIYAIGDNERAARFAAVPIRPLKLGLYGWSGFLAGLCGGAFVLKYGAAKADAEPSLELTAIACVVLGGIRVTGGAGHVGGTVLGVVTVSTLLVGLSGMSPTWRDTVTGVLLVGVAVANEAAARARRNSQ
jgi:rhamnose transport system permease protein